MNINENNQIFNNYLTVISEQQKQQIKQKFAQAVQQPKAQQAMLTQAQELQKKHQAAIADALEKDGGTAGPNIEALLVKIQAALQAAGIQQAKSSEKVNEAPYVYQHSDQEDYKDAPGGAKTSKYKTKQPKMGKKDDKKPSTSRKKEEIKEGFFGRTASLASGAMKKFGDTMAGRSSNTSFRQEAILKHFEKLKTTLGQSLRELQRDMETTSGVDTKVKDAVNNTIAQIETKHKIAPVSSKFSDFRHKAGQFVQNVATGAVVAAPVMAVAAPLAAAVGLTGAGAAAAAAGLTGGSVSMLKDLINGQRPDPKRAAIAAAGAAVTAGLVSHYNATHGAPQPEVPTDTVPHGDVHQLHVDDEIADFQQQHATSYNPSSEMDKAAVDMRASMRDTGLSEYGSTFGAKNIMKNLTDDFAKHARQLGVSHSQIKDIVADVSKNLTPDQLAQLTDDNALRTGKAALEFTKILADKHPELAKKGIGRIAQAFVKKWH